MTVRRVRAASFIRGSASQRTVAALFNPRCFHDDDILPRGRRRLRVPVPVRKPGPSADNDGARRQEGYRGTRGNRQEDGKTAPRGVARLRQEGGRQGT